MLQFDPYAAGVPARLSVIILSLMMGFLGPALAQQPQPDELGALITTALENAGDNADEIRTALEQVPDNQRPGMRFLIAYMPERDLQHLTAAFLLDNVNEAYRAWLSSPWQQQVSQDLFFNDVLPYATIDERRDAWRKSLHERFKPLVAEAQTPGQAAVILNRNIFDLTGVKFSRKRAKANQSSMETLESKMASCTGLSVLLVDACRAVGVPARLVGTPRWSDRSGNHSWVEVWDGQQWRYTGAAEPSGDQLDRGWFTDKAKTAQRDHPLHAIYATSYRPTGVWFPMVWAPNDRSVNAINVTDRYAAVDDEAQGQAQARQEQPKPAGVREDVEASLHAVAQLEHYLKTPRAERQPIEDTVFADVPLTREDTLKSKRLLWDDHVRHIRETRQAEMQARAIQYDDKVMPFFYKTFGEKPEGGRSLYISMHGGGGAPPRVNDQQWENQKRLYEPEEGVYLVPRAATNTWNLWHQDHIDPMFDRLIENMIVLEDVNPNRVYIMGYSAGGDGVYQLAPRMADRLAGAAMMAGHPNEASPLGLRNVAFTIHVGGRDTAYKRNDVAKQWGEKLDALQQADPQGYVHWTEIYPDLGHWMNRKDAAALPWLAKHTRNPLPDTLIWRQDDVIHRRFYWLAIPDDPQQKHAIIRALRDGQRIDIDTTDVQTVKIRLNDDMLDMNQPVSVVSDEKVVFEGRVPRTIGTLAATLAERGDPESVFAGEVVVEIPQAQAK